MLDRLRRHALPVLIALAAALAAGCGACRRCDQERERYLREWGEAEDTERVQEGELVTETWYYWSRGRSVVFFWDERDCACEVSTYTFTPEPDAALVPADSLPGARRELAFRTARPRLLRP
ncbi:MAG: hypothetical protein JW819_06435 [Candidatus Krumholzibacteriota bacterium]|nr:hypothetical protein [Candidatus Krumholzibacteriota bacterium]